MANAKISVGSGPEDMAIDTSTGSMRIIVSCAERRRGKSKVGTFYPINPADNTVAVAIYLLNKEAAEKQFTPLLTDIEQTLENLE